jgi:hypothetical protein
VGGIVVASIMLTLWISFSLMVYNAIALPTDEGDK